MELPPHARRRAFRLSVSSAAVGITSACAEKRPDTPHHRYRCGNYLRMRGEEAYRIARSTSAWELPPHARRRGATKRVDRDELGITSACAEKRPVQPSNRIRPRNYLRMRGEEFTPTAKAKKSQELPPHARRRENQPAPAVVALGITSACAEKRTPRLFTRTISENYLRMRGEESMAANYGV